MRILHLTDHYTPVLGGIEAHVEALAARQASAGHDVTVLTSTPAVADGREADDAGPVSVLRSRSLLTTAADLTSYDVVHAHVSVIAPFSAPRAAEAARRGVPTVVTVHSLWSGTGPTPVLAAHLAGLRSAPVRWTAVSRVAAEQLARRLPRGTRVGVLPNAVSVTARQHVPPQQPGRPVRLVSTMRVARRKRPLPLLRLYADLVRTLDQPVELVVIGDGPQRPRLEREIDRTGLRDQVHVTGRLEPSDVLDRLGASDVYVAPAILESFGLAALEARAVGLPVVGRAGSGLTDFVGHGVDGLLCGSDTEMVGALRRLVVDPALRRLISEHNRTVPSPMTWSRAMAAHDEVYLLARSAARPHGTSVRIGREGR